MKLQLLHWQVAVAATTLATVGVSLAWMNDRAQLRRELATLKAPAVKEAPPKLRLTPKPANVDREILDLRTKVGTLERQVAALKQENERLRKELAELKAKAGAPTAAAPGKTLPQAPSPLASNPPPLPEGDRPAAGAPQQQPWGASEDSEMDEMSQALKLNPEQKDAVRKIVMDGQLDFEKRLIALGQKGERDINAIEREGDAVSQKVRERIRQVLYPEQVNLFDGYMKTKEEAR